MKPMVAAAATFLILSSILSRFMYCSGFVLITEIMNNPSSVADVDGEWFELFNTNNVAVNLQNWTVVGNSPTETFNITSNLIIPPRRYIVLGVNGNRTSNGNVTVNFVYRGGFGGFNLVNGESDKIILLNASGIEIDRVEYNSDANPNGPFPNQEGVSMSLRNVNLDNSNGTNWCAAGPRYNSEDQGTPGSFNLCRIVPAPTAPVAPMAPVDTVPPTAAPIETVPVAPTPVGPPVLPPSSSSGICSSPVNQCRGLLLGGTRVSYTLFGTCYDKCHKSPFLNLILLLGWKCGACA